MGKRWICRNCVEYQTSDDESMDGFPDISPMGNFSKEDISLIIRKVNPTIREVLLVMNTKFNELEKSMQFQSSMFDDLLINMQQIKDENKSLKKEQETMKNTIKQLQDDVLSLQLKTPTNIEDKKNNLVIFGTNGGSNTKQDIKKVFNKLGISTEENDFEAKCLSKENPSKPVLVLFKEKAKRDEVLEKRKKIRKKSNKYIPSEDK